MPADVLTVQALENFKNSIPYGLDMNFESALPPYKINSVVAAVRSEEGSTVGIIDVNCSISRDLTLKYDSWIGSSEFLKYVNFYFILAGSPDSRSGVGQDHVNALYYPDTRAFGLSMLNPDFSDSLSNWDRPWAADISFDQLYQQYGFLSTGYINANDVYNGQRSTFSYADASGQGQFDIDSGRYTGTPLDNDEDMDVITASLRGRSASTVSQTVGRETFFNIVLPFFIPDSFFERFGEKSLSVYSFCQLDINTLASDYNLGQYISNLSVFGGPLKYEKILKWNNLHQQWSKSTTRSIFQDSQGNPYSGLTHFHGKDPETGVGTGPDGYTGWMEGPASGHMAGRKKLSRRTMPNNKVVMSTQGSALDYEGMPLSHRFSVGPLSGVENPLEITINNFATPYGNLRLGEDLMRALRSETGLAEIIKASPESGRVIKSELEKFQDRIFKRLVLRSQKRPSELKMFSNENNPNLQSFNAETFNYSLAAVLNLEDLVASNSKLGHLIDFHRDNIAGSSIEEIRNDVSKSNSYDFITLCLLRCNTQNVQLYRKRVENQPSFNNRSSAPIYGDYNTNVVKRKFIFNELSDGAIPGQTLDSIIYNIDGIPSLSNVDSQGRATISREATSAIDCTLSFGNFKNSPEGMIVPMSIQDYDLFYETSYGNYKYELELNLTDGPVEYMKQAVSEFSVLLDRYRSYVSEYERYIIAQTGNMIAGPAEFSRAMRINMAVAMNSEGNPDQKYGPLLNQLVAYYSFLLFVLTRSSALLDTEMKEELISSLQYKNYSFPTVRFFLDKCNTLEHTLRTMVHGKDIDIENTLNMGTHKRSASFNVSKEHPASAMNIKGELPNVMVAHPPGTVFIDYSNIDLRNPEISDSYRLFYIHRTRYGESLDIKTARIRRGPDGSIYVKPNAVPTRVDIAHANEVPAHDGQGIAMDAAPAANNAIDAAAAAVDNAMDMLGGMTWSSLVSKAASLNPDLQSGCGDILEDETVITEDVSQAVLDSILSNEDFDIIRENTRDNNDNFLFREDAIPLLADTIARSVFMNVYIEPASMADALTPVPDPNAITSNGFIPRQRFYREESDSSGASTTTQTDTGNTETETTISELYASGQLHAAGEATANGDLSEPLGIFTVGGAHDTAIAAGGLDLGAILSSTGPSLAGGPLAAGSLGAGLFAGGAVTGLAGGRGGALGGSGPASGFGGGSPIGY